MPRIHFHDIDVPREKAKALRDELRAAGFLGTRLTAAQKVVALVYGYSSWAELRRTLRSDPFRDDLSSISDGSVVRHLLDLVGEDREVAIRVASAVRFGDVRPCTDVEGRRAWRGFLTMALSVGASDLRLGPGRNGIEVGLRSSGLNVLLKSGIPVESYDRILDHVVGTYGMSATSTGNFTGGRATFPYEGQDHGMRLELVPVRTDLSTGRWSHVLLVRILRPDGQVPSLAFRRGRELRDACGAENAEIEQLPEVVAIRARWSQARENLMVPA